MPEEKPAAPETERSTRKRLEDVFRELSLVHAVVTAVGGAAENQAADHDIEHALVLRVPAADPLWQQLMDLTEVIETMGGKTELSEDGEDEVTR